MSGEPAFPTSRFDSWLSALRTDGRKRAGLAFAGIVIGLLGSTVSWFALVLGGALVALPARSFRRGFAAGFGLGLLQLALFVGLLVTNGAFGGALQALTGQIGAVTVLVGLAAPLLGSLVRGVV